MADGFFQKRRRFPIAWVLPPLVLAAYLVLFPVPGGEESYVRPVWAVALSQSGQSSGSGASESFPFRVGDLFGYATAQGDLLHLERVRFGVALSTIGFINYGPVPDHFVFMNPLGQMQYSMEGSGYPILSEDGRTLYAVASDLGSIRRLGEDGEVLWSLGFATQITGLALSGEQCVVGLLEGRLVSIGPEGQVLYEHAPPGSRIPVVLSVAVGPGGAPIAAVAGVDPQSLLLVERQGAAHTLRLAVDLGSDFRRSVLLRFSADGRFLYVEGADGLRVLDVRRHRLSAVPVPGRVQAMAGGGVITAVAARRETGVQLVVLRPLRGVLCEAPLDPGAVLLEMRGEALFIGLEGYLLRADVVRG